MDANFIVLIPIRFGDRLHASTLMNIKPIEYFSWNQNKVSLIETRDQIHIDQVDK